MTISHEVEIDGVRYRPIEAAQHEQEELGSLLHNWTLEGERYWRDRFIERDTLPNGKRYGMYSDGDEEAPFFSEAFLYNLLGKDDARTLLGIVRRLATLAGVRYR